MTDDDKDLIEFHNFALRVPKALYKLIEDVAWQNRTSVNIQIVDLLLFSVIDVDRVYYKATWDDLPEAQKAGALSHPYSILQRTRERLGRALIATDEDRQTNHVEEVGKVASAFYHWKLSK